MARINLLDWRAARREARKKQFIVWCVLGLALAGSIVGAAYLAMDSAIDNQRARNERLRQEIAVVERKIKEIEELEKVKQNLLARMRVIEELQASRSATVHLFDQLVETLPEGLYLKSVEQRGSTVTIKGVAESNGRVSAYMRNLERSPWFDRPRLLVIRNVERNRLRQAEFELTVRSRTTPEQSDAQQGEEVVE